MKPEIRKSESQSGRHGLGHISVSCVAGKQLIPEIRILKSLAKDLTEIKRADYRLIFTTAYKEIFVRFFRGVQKQLSELILVVV
jgi:hypothetical protein